MTVKDSNGLTDSLVLSIFVHPVNDPPFLSIQNLTLYDDNDANDQLSFRRQEVLPLICQKNRNCQIVELQVSCF
jgi:hypothetical protein